MSLTLEDLFTPLTPDQVKAELLDIATALQFDVTAWEPLGAARAILAIVGTEIANNTEVTAIIARSGLLDFAANTDGTINPWLTLLSKSLYNVERQEASFASTATYVLTNSSGSPITVNPDDLHLAITTGINAGALFKNDTGGVVAASGGTLVITVTADVAGAGSTATANTITTFVTPVAGLTGTNPDPAVGTDVQSDAELVELCRESLGAASPDGPELAYDFFAKRDENRQPLKNGSATIGVNRTKVSKFSPTAQVLVYVAKPSGVVPGTVGNLTTDLGIVADNIFRNAMPTAVTVTVSSAAGLNVGITADVWMSSANTLLALDVQNTVLAKLQAYFETIPIGGFDIGGGGKIFLDAIIGQIFQAIPGKVVQVTISSPGGDVTVAPNQVALLTSVAADFTIHQL
jgi:hypothetical protein